MIDFFAFVFDIAEFILLEILMILVFIVMLASVNVEIKEDGSDDVYFYIEGWSGYTFRIIVDFE